MAEASPIWRRDKHADRRPRLLLRARVMSALRAYFAVREFIEVEPAILQVSPGNEAHLHGFATTLHAPDGGPAPAWLHTSPEFAMKKLLAAGESRIFALARVFRNKERGALHAPEFTMLEWYRTHEPLEAIMLDCADILRLAAEAAGATQFTFRGRSADPLALAQRLRVREAFLRYAGIDLYASLPLGAPPDAVRLAQDAMGAGLRLAPDDRWSDIFSRILSERVEPHLGLGEPVILYEYPACEAALARVCAHDPRVAERFELYVCGVELANAFGELTDASEQRRRLLDEMDEKQRVYGERYPLDEDFLNALEHMPQASGAALGVDRLIMLACGAQRIDEVQWTPVFMPTRGGR